MTRYSRHQRAAFTLIELMAVVALIAIMMALLTPAVRGLLGVTGPRGGVNTLSAAIEQARLTAMENGVASYLGLPIDEQGISEEKRFSSFIVFRDARPDEDLEDDQLFVPVTRWLRLPQGVFFEVMEETTKLHEVDDIPDDALPRLEDLQLSDMKALKFDRFGKLRENQAGTNNVVLKVGAKNIVSEKFPKDKGNYFRFDVVPLTGRAFITDMSLEEDAE